MVWWVSKNFPRKRGSKRVPGKETMAIERKERGLGRMPGDQTGRKSKLGFPYL